MRLLLQTRGVEIGGNETVLRHLLEGWNALGWQTQVVVPPGPVARWLRDLGHSTEPPPAPGGWADFLEHAEPDHVFITCASALFPLAPLCRRRAVPVSWLYHAPQRQWLETQGILKLAFASVDQIFTPSRYLVHELSPPASLPVVTIPNGVLVPPVPSSPPHRTALGWDASHFVVGYSARFETRKRHDLLLQAFHQFHRRCPEARLLLLGRNERAGRFPSTAPQVWDRIQSLDLEHAVRWVAAEPDSVDHFLSQLDLFCFPPRGEAQGCALLEAMAMGVPVLAARAEGVEELFESGAPGWTVPPDDAEALAEAMKLAWKFRHRLKGWGARGTTFVRQAHGMDAMVRRYADGLRAARALAGSREGGVS